MSRYVDGFVIPIKKKNLTAYKKMAALGRKIWMEYGALDYYECVGANLKNSRLVILLWAIPHSCIDPSELRVPHAPKPFSQGVFMKSILLLLIATTMTLSAQANDNADLGSEYITSSALIRSAKLDAAKENILIDVTYGGGCGEHHFSLELAPCRESYPVQCTAKLVQQTNDFCEALVSTEIKISLKDAGLTGSYFERASLTIVGENDWETNLPSKASVRLP